MFIFIDGFANAFNGRLYDKRSVTGQPIDVIFKANDAQKTVFTGKIIFGNFMHNIFWP